MLPRYLRTGLYRDREYDRTRGFRVLAHAEVEAFLEEICEEFAKRAVAAWNADGRPRRSIDAIVATGEGVARGTRRLVWADGTSQLTPRRTPITTSTVASGLAAYQRLVIQKNHGLKDSNILNLTARIGILATELDSVWLANMKSFGDARGETAHTSRRTQSQPDPRNESKTLIAVVEGFRPLDRALLMDR